MAQRIDGLYRLVTFPKLYKGLQQALGAPAARDAFITQIARMQSGMKVLDVGCGPGTMFPHIPAGHYTGIDLNPKHITHATQLHGGKARFIAGDAATALQAEASSFDVIIVSALLHHLGDDEARHLLEGLIHLCKPGGWIATLDNVWLKNQNPVARLLNSLDSGLNIRTREQYLALTSRIEGQVESRTLHGLLAVPYDYFCMTITRKNLPLAPSNLPPTELRS